jgi:pyrrolidone-carboxylate peptidase
MHVTGFEPFQNFDVNPSTIVAKRLSSNAEILKVSYPFVEAFAKKVQGDTILCLGLNANLSEPAFELYAHNAIGQEPDASGHKDSRTIIKKGAPRTLGQTIAGPDQLISLPMKTSFTPGNYLCNFLLYSLLIRYPDRKIGFVHVPLLENMPEFQQVRQLKDLVKYLGIQ